MEPMPKKNPLSPSRVLALLLVYITLCFAGGIAFSVLFVPAIYATNNTVAAVLPSLRVEGVDLNVTSLPQKSRLYASDGKTLIASFYTQNRVVVPLKNISTPMQQAVVAREDRRFFKHSGIDFQGIMRAFIETYIKKGATQGGSSLTQQYVKNALMAQAREKGDSIAEYHASEDTIARKIREMLIAVQMEHQYSKLEILQGYLNIAQFGGNSLYGVETAARRYFNVSAADLNVIQAATIAAITKNPTKYDPAVEANQAESEKQRNIVLDLMYEQGYIDKAEYEKDIKIPLKDTLDIQSVATNAGCQTAGDYAFFCDYAVKQILNSKEFGKTVAERRNLINEGGLDIYSTLDIEASKAAMDAARSTIPVDDPSGFEVTIAAIKPGTGEVLAFGSNRIYDATDESRTNPTHTAVNYAVDEIDGGGRGWPVGSTWKPINMVAWMEKGHSINEMLRTSTSYANSSFNCNEFGATYNVNTGFWSVQNSGGGTVSPESPLQGLIRSHNTTQASMAQRIGICAIGNSAKELGYHNAAIGSESVFDKSTFTPSMTIGTVAASPLTMANVYATIGADGVMCTPIALKKIVNNNGKSLKVPSANCHQAISSEIAQTTAYALNQGVVQRGGEANVTQLDNNRKTFAKTGTNEDSYMTTGGFDPHRVAAFVSVNNAESKQSFNGMRINGVYRSSWYGMYIATPAWKAFMNNYLAAINAPVDEDSYGTPAQKYIGNSAATSTTTNNNVEQNSQNATTNNSPTSTTDDDYEYEYVYVDE